MDVVKNEVSGVNPTSIPSIMLYPKKAKNKPIEFDLDFKIGNIINWIKLYCNQIEKEITQEEMT